MINVRNNLVAVRLVTRPEQMIGKILVPDNDKCFGEAEVVAVGPGLVLAHGARPDTHDLRVGQRVFVKHSSIRPTAVGNTPVPDGIKYTDDGEQLIILAESSIVGIIAEPATEEPVAPKFGYSFSNN